MLAAATPTSTLEYTASRTSAKEGLMEASPTGLDSFVVGENVLGADDEFLVDHLLDITGGITGEASPGPPAAAPLAQFNSLQDDAMDLGGPDARKNSLQGADLDKLMASGDVKTLAHACRATIVYASSDATETPPESESFYETGSETGEDTGSETGSSSYESYTGSSSASDSAADDRSASSADDQSASAADDQSASSADDVLGAGAAAGLAGVGAAAGAAAVGDASPGGHSAELDYDGPELGHDAELDYQGADGLPELLPRAAADTPAPRGFARPGDLSAGGMES